MVVDAKEAVENVVEDAEVQAAALNAQESADDFDAKADAFLNREDTPSESSSEKETKDEEVDESESDEGTDLDKKSTDEDKEAETSDDVPKEFHKNPAWQRILKQRDEATEKANQAEEKAAQLDKVLSNPAFIRMQMQTEGYKDEAINEKLRDLGHSVQEVPVDDVKLVVEKLGINLDQLDQNGKDYINTTVADMAKVADVIIQDRMAKMLPEHINPLAEKLSTQEHDKNVDAAFSSMREQVKGEEILDFEKDIKPELNAIAEEARKEGVDIASPEFLDNLVAEFPKINHRLTIERLRTKGKRGERDEKRADLKGNRPGTHNIPGKLPERTGDFDEDADAFFAARGQ